MAEALPLSDAEIRLLDSLVRHGVEFMIVGLSAAALQGAPTVTEDVDLWFENLHDPKLRAALREVGAAYVPAFELNPPMLAGAGAQLFDIVLRMDGLRPFAEEISGALTMSLGGVSVKVLPLQRILASKQAANGTKDRAIIPVLRDALLAQSTPDNPESTE